MKEIHFNSASKLTQAIKNQELTAVQVLKATYKRIQQHNTTINAIVELRTFEDALKEAKAKDDLLKKGTLLGPLHGLPMTVKDSYNVKGMVSTNGNPMLTKNVAQTDAALVQKLKNAGAIIIGKTNLPLLAMDWQSTNKWYGQTNNPYHLDHVAGGSSGGAAASLAAGFSSLEIGSDAGGSIRVPAHFCGICGLRPTEGALPSRGHLSTPKKPRIGRYLTVCGPMARNMEDLILLTKVLWSQGAEWAEIPPVPLTISDWNPNQSLRIAYSKTLNNCPMDKEYAAIFQNFIAKLQPFNPVEKAPILDNDYLIHLWGRIIGFDMKANLPAIPGINAVMGTFFRLFYKDKQWAGGIKAGLRNNATSYMQALEEKDQVRDAFNAFFNDWDIWLTPAAAMPAYQHTPAGKPLPLNGKKIPYTSGFTPFNFATTIPGHPVVVIPIGQTSKGLPVGIQIHGAAWQDHKLLKIAQFLEQFTDGFQIPKQFT